MSKSRQTTAPDSVPRLKFARRVTRRQGEVFAEHWLYAYGHTESMTDAFAETRAIEWPDEPAWPISMGQNPRQARYMEIEDEILERTFAAVKGDVAEAFVKAAREILDRERRRQCRQLPHR
jgi:hypothetical protein